MEHLVDKLRPYYLSWSLFSLGDSYRSGVDSSSQSYQSRGGGPDHYGGGTRSMDNYDDDEIGGGGLGNYVS